MSRLSGNIHGELVPCTFFLGDTGLTEEKKKELWVNVMADNVELQQWIDEGIPYANTLQHKIYVYLIEHPDAKITFN